MSRTEVVLCAKCDLTLGKVIVPIDPVTPVDLSVKNFLRNFFGK
jgi:hypothetical protein